MNFRTRFGILLDRKFSLVLTIFLLFQVSLVFIFTFINFKADDLNLYYNQVKSIQAGSIPYLTTSNFELQGYPILFTYLMSFLSFFNLSFKSFQLVMGLIQVLSSFLILITLSKLLVLDKRDKRLVLYLFLCPVFVFLMLRRFDLIPTSLSLLSYYYARRNGSVKSGFFLALGIAFKLFPAVFILAYLFLKNFNYKKFFLTVSITLLIIYSPALILMPETILYPIKFDNAVFNSFSFSWTASRIFNFQFSPFLLLLFKSEIIAIFLTLSLLFIRKVPRFGALLIIMIYFYNTIGTAYWSVWVLPWLLLSGVNPLIIIFFDVVSFTVFPYSWDNMNFNFYIFNNAPLGAYYHSLFLITNVVRYLILIYVFGWLIRAERKSYNISNC